MSSRPPTDRPVRARLLGLFFSVVWLGFLVAPVVNSFALGTAAGVGLATGLVVFAGGYVWAVRGMRRLFVTQDPDPRAVVRSRWELLALALLSGVLTAAGGWLGTATVPFLAVVSIVALPPRASLLVVVVLAGGVELLSWRWTGGLHDPRGVALGTLISGFTVWGFALFMARNRALLRVKDAESALALAEQRDRFARDLHDILGHSLTAISVKAELAGRLLETDAPRRAVRTEVADLERLARDALSDVRRAVSGYREITLPGELARARTVLTAAGIQADLPTATEAVESRLRELFAWTVREGVTNVVRHSGASSCTITLTDRAITVTDDGTGPVARGSSGSGLTGLRERARSAGAAVVTGNGRPRGFVLHVEAR